MGSYIFGLITANIFFHYLPSNTTLLGVHTTATIIARARAIVTILHHAFIHI